MIKGIGADIVEVARVRQSLDRHGDAFLGRVLTAAEQAAADGRGEGRLLHVAGRWAAKEAIAKALGCGFGADCLCTDIEVTNTPAGGPSVALRGQGAATAARLGISRWHLSISHEHHYAVAFAIAEG